MKLNDMAIAPDAILRTNPSKIVSVCPMVLKLLSRVFSNHALYSLFSIGFNLLYPQNYNIILNKENVLLFLLGECLRHAI